MPATNSIRKPRSVNKTSIGPQPKPSPAPAPAPAPEECPPFAFPETAIVTVTERDFLQQHTPQAVLDMIKSGTYDSELTAFLRIGDPLSEDSLIVLRMLFGKHLTQSDVGQRKGLVIPKKDAEEYFPDVRRCEEESMMLRFLDRRTRQWMDLRYCFYQSSQSYVLTTGWCKFVKVNHLKEKDVIKFYECVKKGGGCEERYIMIDTECSDRDEIRVRVEAGLGEGEGGVGGGETMRKSVKRVREEVMVVRKRRYSTDMSRERNVIEIDGDAVDTHRGVRLFGVIIGYQPS